MREIYFLRFLKRFWGSYISWRGFQVRSEPQRARRKLDGRMFLGKTEVSERSEDSGDWIGSVLEGEGQGQGQGGYSMHR